MKDQNKPLEWLAEPKHESASRMISIIPPGAKYTIVTDWFQQICMETDPIVGFGCPLDEYVYDSGRIVFRKMKYSAPLFNDGYSIIFDGKPFGRCHVNPKKNGVLKENTVQFELENNVQYEAGWLGDVKYFYDRMKWKVKNTSRVDIALDGRGFFDVWKKYEKGEIDRRGGGKEQIFRLKRNALTGFDIGSRASDKWITCYNKSEEVKRSNKHYISDFWKRSGLDITCVERLELKLRNDALKEISFDWRRLDDFEYLASIFRTFIEGGYTEMINEHTGEIHRKNKVGMLTFIEPSSDKNISRKKKIRYIDWDYIGAVPLERLSTEKSSEVWAMKIAIKKMVWLSVATSARAEESSYTISDSSGHVVHRVDEDEKKIYRSRSLDFLSQAREMATNINALQWLIDNIEEWRYQYSRKKLRYLPNYRLSTSGDQLSLTPIVVL